MRLKKNDLFKVGRVRFKVREIVTPFYEYETGQNDDLTRRYRLRYPVLEPSVNLSSSQIEQQLE